MNDTNIQHRTIRRAELRAIVCFAVAIATEAGPTPQRLTVPSRGGYGGTPIGSGGYTLGVLQFDFGHNGIEAMESNRSFAQALGEEINAWAAAVKRPRLSMPVGPVRGELDFVRIIISNRRAGGLVWLPRNDWDLVRAWGDSDRGRQWVWRNIEQRQIDTIVDKVQDVFAVAPLGEWRREDQIKAAVVLAKAWHRRAAVYQSLLAFLADRPEAGFEEFERRVAVEEVNYPTLQLGRATDAARFFVEIERSKSVARLVAHAIERMAAPDFSVLAFREDPALRMLCALFKDCGHAARAIDRLDALAQSERPLLAWQVADGLGDFDALIYDDAKDELLLRTISVRCLLTRGAVAELDAQGQALRTVTLSASGQAPVGRAAESTDAQEPAPRWIPPKGARIFRLPPSMPAKSTSDGPIVGESGGHWIQQTGADVYLAIPKTQVVAVVQPGLASLRLVFTDGRATEATPLDAAAVAG